jgi:hypothetical protein
MHEWLCMLQARLTRNCYCLLHSQTGEGYPVQLRTDKAATTTIFDLTLQLFFTFTPEPNPHVD